MKIEIEASPAGKALLIGVVGIVVGIVAVLLNRPTLLVVGCSLAAAGLIAIWAVQPRCHGYVKWTGTEDNEIQIANCSECDRWTLSLRGEYVAHGKGFDAFVEAVNKVADSHQQYLPHVAMRLRKVLELIEGNQKPEDGFETENET